MEVETFSSGMRSNSVSMSSMRIDRHADFSDFAHARGMIGIQPNLRRQIERHGKPRLAFAKQIAVPLVGFSGAGEARVLAHGPEAAAIHGGINAARVGKFAGVAQRFFRAPRAQIFRGIKSLERQA